jgi:DNA repair protein SbcC/Rad50
MKLFDRLRRPAWQHKDPAVRRRALSGDDPQLLAALPELASTDPDPGVRSAALRRLSDAGLLARRAVEDNDAGCATVARERLIELLCGDALPLSDREALLAATDDARIITAVATDASDSTLRRLALQRVQRPGLLFERCLADSDPALRQWLLQRIDSPESLLRLAESARRKDKALARAARERAEALQFAAGNTDTLARRAQSLCERLERLARELPPTRDEILAQAQREAAELAPRIPPDLQARLSAHLDLADTAMRGARGEPAVDADEMAAVIAADPPSATIEGAADEPEPAAPATGIATPADVPVDESAVAAELDRIEATIPPPGSDRFGATLGAARRALEAIERSAARLPDALQARCTDLQARLTEHRAAHDRLQAEQSARREAELAAALAALEEAIAEGHLADARAARRRIDARDVPKPLRARLDAADQQVAQLETWQRWSGHSVRERLCQHAEALHGSGLHPDAVMQRVRELQDEWQRLDRLDGAAAPGKDSGPARRFRALCQRALAPTRAYFEKRGELRDQRAAQVTALLQQVDAALDDPARSDAARLLPLRRQVTAALRELDAVPPEQRGALGRALRERLARFDAARHSASEQAVSDKRRLLARLRRELGQATGADAAALARNAQAEWKRLPRGDRAQEEPLWQELRSLVEPLFERERDVETRQRSERAEADAAAQAVLDELDALAAADPERLAHADAHLDSLTARWRALAPAAEPEPPRGPRERERGSRERPRPRSRAGHPLDARFDAAVVRVQAARARLHQQRAQQEIERLAEAGALLDSAAADPAARDALLQRYAALELAGDARGAWQARALRLSQGLSEADGDADAAAADAVRAELAAGLDSPPECAALRRREQMQRLAARMQGEAAVEPKGEVRAALIALYARSGIAPAQRSALRERIQAAYRALAGAR